ncbi:MAG: c-type cytochrome, partial [Bacteroidales bacterium]
MKKTFFIAIFLCMLTISGLASTLWEVPQQYTNIKNPELITSQALLKGKNVFTHSCADCHGTNADGKGLILSPSFKDKNFINQSDGAIFYKISTGRNQVPGFKNQLTEQQIWQVIHYLRSLTDTVHYPVLRQKSAIVSLRYDSATNTIVGWATDEKDDTLSSITFKVFAKQSFGWYPIAEVKSDTVKIIRVSVPVDLVGDTMGNLTIK